MATLTSSSGSSPSGRTTPFRVATREISLDFSTVGPEQSPSELGVFTSAAFSELIEKFAAIPVIKLIDGDPQLIVTSKRGRFVVLPSNGKLLLRPANDPQQPYIKFDPTEVPSFLDTSDQPGQAQTPDSHYEPPPEPPAPPPPALRLASPPPPQTPPPPPPAVIASAEATIPPSAPIYGAFPEKVGRLVSNTPFPLSVTPPPAAPPPRKVNRSLIFSLVGVFVAAAAATLWIFYGPAPAEKPRPPAPPSEFDLVTATDQIASLSKRFAGTYATSGADGERLLELRPNGTFHYQEFGTGLARTTNRTGTYVFAFLHATKTPLIRASGLGTIDLLDEKKISCQSAVFSRLP